MALNIYNTTTRTKGLFEPHEPGKVGLYACGPTVYDYFHVGNARAFVVFDTLRRVLVRRGFEVNYVQNITDIDDKIINRANAEGVTVQVVAEKYTAAFFEDMAALGCLPCQLTPKATEHIPEIIALISRMLEKEHAYVSGRDVFFAVRKFGNYGCLSGKKIDELEKGARVEVNEQKRDPLDFTLWKGAKPGEPAWESPWGEGRPGWHIECSAMSMKYLGESFDIHGGGADLIFPHHENENAQSECVTGKPLAKYWMHNGYLKIDGEKMSKSLGNFWVTRDVLKVIPYQVLRLFLLSAHYRSPLDFNPENVEAAGVGYHEFKRTLERLAAITGTVMQDDYLADEKADVLNNERCRILEKFEFFLDDDLNTAGAIGQLFSLANKIRQVIAGRPKKTFVFLEIVKRIETDLKGMAGVLGIVPDIVPVPEEILEMITSRNQARADKNWALSDQLRDQITGCGYSLEDTPFGSLALTENKVALEKLFNKQ